MNDDDHATSVVPAQIVQAALGVVGRKKALPALSKWRFDAFTERRCAQTLHLGPFSEEGLTIQRVHDFILARGKLSGKNHGPYFSDLQRADPSK